MLSCRKLLLLATAVGAAAAVDASTRVVPAPWSSDDGVAKMTRKIDPIVKKTVVAFVVVRVENIIIFLRIIVFIGFYGLVCLGGRFLLGGVYYCCCVFFVRIVRLYTCFAFGFWAFVFFL